MYKKIIIERNGELVEITDKDIVDKLADHFIKDSAVVHYNTTRFNYDDKNFPGDENSGEYLVDDTGYIDQNRLINDMLTAGSLLDQQRASLRYDSDDEINVDGDEYELPFNPTRQKGFDDLDSRRIMNYYADLQREKNKGGNEDVSNDSNGSNNMSSSDSIAVRNGGSVEQPVTKPATQNDV